MKSLDEPNQATTTEIQIPRRRRFANITASFARKPAPRDTRLNDTAVTLRCNLLNLNFTSKETYANQYSIKVIPEIAQDNYPLLRKVIKSINKDLQGYYYPFFQSGYTLFSAAKNVDESMTFQTSIDDKEFTLIVEKTKNVVDLTGIKSTTDENIKIKNFIELLIKNIVSLNNNLVRFDDSSFFNYQNIQSLTGKSYMMPGFSTSVVITESGLFLRINDSNKFMNGKTAWEKLTEFRSTLKNGAFLAKAKEYFNHKSVLAKYGVYRVYQISDITVDKNVDNTTISKVGADGVVHDISWYNYYKEEYGIEIKERNQPMLISKTRVEGVEAIYLIPELCYLTGMDEEMENEAGLRKGMVSRTKKNANDKMKAISAIKDLWNNTKPLEKKHKKTKENIVSKAPNDYRKEWGLDFWDFLELKGRRLEPPMLCFADNKMVKIEKGRYRCDRLASPISFNSNEWLCVTTRENFGNAEQMVKGIVDISSQFHMGVDIGKPKIEQISARSSTEFVDWLKQLNWKSNSYKLIWFVLDGRYTKSFYPSIKEYICLQVGIPSQCVLSENRSKGRSYFQNVLNQMVVKAGGQIFTMQWHYMLSSNRTMIIGLDSSRAFGNKKKFVMTTSYNQFYNKFNTQQIVSEGTIEACQVTLRSMLVNSLTNFEKQGGQKPVFVIVYRNGGNDKQKQMIYEDEFKVFKEVLEETNKIKFIFICVNKKTDLKFFEVNNRGWGNPESGTVVDSAVTTPGYYEFYWQPQFVNQGTATPVHYHCWYDSIGIPLEDLEMITYKQTYYYWNWPGPIREPAVLKFAEVCNKFTTSNLKNGYAEGDLVNTPFYI